jgi:Tfp pilus assembly protein PilV
MTPRAEMLEVLAAVVLFLTGMLAGGMLYAENDRQEVEKAKPKCYVLAWEVPEGVRMYEETP